MKENMNHTNDVHTHDGTHVHTHDGEGYHTNHSHTHNPEEIRAIVNRLKRSVGHLDKVRRMVENGDDCSEVLIQLSAIESAINSVSRVILKEHLSTCVIDAVRRDDIEAIEELNRAIDKFIK